MSGPPLWGSLTAAEAAGLGGRGTVAVLPLAAVEQHGPHLPLSTDLDIGTGIVGRALAALPAGCHVSVLPPLWLGTSDEHAGFPGTLGVAAGLLAETIVQVGSAVARAGVRRLVLANSHGGNRAAMDVAALRLRKEHAMLVVKASWFRFPRPEGLELPEGEWRHGLHAGAVETAMMLHLHPERVRTGEIRHVRSLGEELEGKLRRLGPEGPASFAWLAGDLGPEGVAGDPRLATAAIGERLIGHYGRVLADVIQDALDFPLDRLV